MQVINLCRSGEHRSQEMIVTIEEIVPSEEKNKMWKKRKEIKKGEEKKEKEKDKNEEEKEERNVQERRKKEEG